MGSVLRRVLAERGAVEDLDDRHTVHHFSKLLQTLTRESLHSWQEKVRGLELRYSNCCGFKGNGLIARQESRGQHPVRKRGV